MTYQLDYSTRRREFDYLQIHWLEKTSGRPAPDWDLYVVKELLDNALDADERWAREHVTPIEVSVNLNYRHMELLDIHSLKIAVCNQASFPIDTELIRSIFDLTAYTSDKSHTNYPSRGDQGNALKTVLGIPYALRHFGYGDYDNIHAPLTIETDGRAFTITLEVDEVRQQIHLVPLGPKTLKQPRSGACVHVRIDWFEQEKPRTSADLRSWAERFALFNPHATFHWHVRVGNQQDTWNFPANLNWKGVFADTAPLHWYEYSQLRELLLSLERDRGPDASLPQILQIFAGFAASEDPDGTKAKALCDKLKLNTLGDLRLTSDHVRTLRDGLWPALQREGRRVPAEMLGGLGEADMAGALGRFFSLEASPLYRRVVRDAPADPAHPFVLELALARLPSGNRRVIWTGLNHTPTYEDPFYVRSLNPPIRPGEPVFGLDGFLDAYGLTADQPVLLVMHIICPNLAFQDFSKTGIDPRPFREPLAATLGEMLTLFTATQRHEMGDLGSIVRTLLPETLRQLSPDNQQQFAAPQLLRAVRRLLAARLRDEGRAELAESWLSDPGADARLQGYIQVYQGEQPEAFANLIQPERGRLTLPLHPNGHTTIPLSSLDQGVFEEACVNKLLVVPGEELEAVLVANGVLTRLDAALLRSEGDFDGAFKSLLSHLGDLSVTVALLHDASPMGCSLAERLRQRLNEASRQDTRLVDLGLTPTQGGNLGLPTEAGSGGGDRTALAGGLAPDEVTFLIDRKLQYSLYALAPVELAAWLESRCAEAGLPPKLVPDEAELRSTALSTMKDVLSSWVLDRFHEVNRANFLADRVMQGVAADLKPDDLPGKLREALQAQPAQAWRTLWSEIVTTRCREVLEQRHEQIEMWIETHKP